MFTAGILTVSDRGWRGDYQDKSGPVARKMMSRLGYDVVKSEVVPDERDIIANRLVEWADEAGVDVIITTGGTGLSPRDVTPEATLLVIDRLVPGLAEAMRAESLKKTPAAMLSRAVTGVRRNSLIINLPGKPDAVRQCLEVILPAIPHALETIRGEADE